jgi:hypothetical protein
MILAVGQLGSRLLNLALSVRLLGGTADKV